MQQKVYNTLGQAQDAILAKNPESIFLVTGRNSFSSSGAQAKLERILLGNVTHFYDFAANPKIEDARRGIALYHEAKPDLILAVGGGSVMDMAKLIKGLANSENPEISARENKPIPSSIKMIAIPTTSGSGSETTPFAVIYIDGKKYSLEHDSLLPNEIVLDPTLTYSLSARQTAVTGIDALCQAIESYWSINSTQESKQHSRKTIPLILRNLEAAVNNPSPESRAAMMQAANLAGKAIAIAKTTAPHAISYTMTSHFGVPHGHAVALTLGDVFEYNANVTKENCIDKRGTEYVQDTMRELIELLGVQSAEEAKEKIRALMKSIGLSTKLSDLDILDVGPIIENTNPQRLKNNPTLLEKSDVRRILDKIS